MKGMLMIARRDLAAYLNGYWGYAVIAAVLVIDGVLFNALALTDKSRYSAEVLETFFYWTFGCTAVAAVLLSMRLVASEKESGTIVLLEASPLAPWQIVAGKYLSVMAVLTLLVALSTYMPALVAVNGKVSMGHIAAGYLGLLLVAAAVAAIGTFASTVSRLQLVAGFLSAMIVVLLVIMWWVARVADPPIKDVLSYMSLFQRHYEGFMRGQIHTEDVIFYLSICFVFLMGSTRFLAMRRWR